MLRKPVLTLVGADAKLVPLEGFGGVVCPALKRLAALVAGGAALFLR